MEIVEYELNGLSEKNWFVELRRVGSLLWGHRGYTLVAKHLKTGIVIKSYFGKYESVISSTKSLENYLENALREELNRREIMPLTHGKYVRLS